MVNKTKSVALKSPEKMVVGKKLVVQVKAPLTTMSERKSKKPIANLPSSPNSSAWNVEDNLVSLRIENKRLADAVQAVATESEKQIKHNFDLVWFVRNRMRYPTHEASIRIEKSQVYKEHLDLLRGPNGDYHHGVHAAMLAASRMFKDHVDVVDRNGSDGEKDEVKKLREQNKLMTDALKSLIIEANRQTERASAIMWFARNRLRHPTHEKTKLIETSPEFKDDLEKIRGPQGEYHFGFNTGLLEATHIFKEHANVPFFDVDEVAVADDIQKVVLASKEAFPRTETESFPPFD